MMSKEVRIVLEISLCTDRKRNTLQILDRICEQAAGGCGGQILVAPEQFSHAAERLLCMRGGDKISRFAEVLSFSRLASRVFSLEGGAADSETDAGGRLLMMAMAVEQVRSRLKIFGISASRPEFLLRLIDTLEEFRSFCVTAPALRHASEELSGALAVKMEEFSLLMESYDSVCANCGQNPDTRLNRLLAALETGSYAEGEFFYFDGFTDFNGVQREIIAQLLSSGAEIRVNLTCDSLDNPGQQYESARETALQLLSMARAQKVEAKISVLRPPQGPDALEFLREKLFAGGMQRFDAPQEAVCLRIAADLHLECRWAAGEILRLVSEGARWRDITVVYTDEAGYRPVLESILRSAEIPAYYAGNRSLLQEPVIQFVLSALEAATDGLEQEPVLAYLKSGLSPLTRERCDRMDNYILLWNINAGIWERQWTMNPYGFAKPIDATGEILLTELNQDRQAALKPLLRLRDGLRGAKNTAGMVLVLNDFLEEVQFSERLNEMASELYSKGELQRAQEYAQIYGILCTAMEQTFGVLGKSVRTPEDFFAIFKSVLSQYNIGSIPAKLDCVTVGGLMSQRRSDTDYLFLLGANEGFFPATQENRGLLTDSERVCLMRIGIGVSPAADGRLSRELAGIHDVLTTPVKRIYFSAVEGKEAYYFRRADRLFPGSLAPAQDKELICRSKYEYLTRLSSGLPDESGLPDGITEQELHGLRKALSYAPGNLRPETVRALYGRTLRLSSTKIDVLAGCRFSYFLQYGLKAKERKPAQLDAPLYGTFVHYVLEHTVRQAQEEGGFSAVAPERVLSLAEGFMEEYAKTQLASLWDSDREGYLLRRTFAEVRQVVRELYDELSQSEFVPQWFELEFSSRGLLPAVRIAGQHMTAELEGYVDRADVWRDGEKLYVRIVDYKTGKKDFDYTNVLNGIGLQMLLYLFALEKHGSRLTGEPLLPAGVLYFPARMEQVTVKDKFSDADANAAHRKLLRRQGLLLNDYRVLQAMEPSGGDPVYLPYSHGKDGSRTGDLADPEQLRLLERHVFHTVAALADEVARGEVTPNPYFRDEQHNACRWCPYQTLCADTAERRWLDKLGGPEEFWKLIGEEDVHE